MRLFYWFAKNISYTFAVSFFTVLTALPVGLFSFFLSTSFIVELSSNIMEYVIFVFIIALPTAALLHYIQFGLLTPLKIPAFMKGHREINRAYKNNFDNDPETIENMYTDISYLPMYEMLSAVFYTALAGVVLLGYSFYHYQVTSVFSLVEMKVLAKMLILALTVTMILYGLFSYLLSEALTNRERTMLYNRLLREGIKKRPRILIGVRFKFFFFVMLMVIALLSFAALMEKGGYYGEIDTMRVIIYFVVSILAGLVLMQITTNSIVKTLGDIESVSRNIASGGRAEFSVLSLEKEFASIEFSMMEMAWEIDEHRQNLEERVEQRTRELQDALSDLKGRDDLMQKQLDMASIIQKSILPGNIDDWNELKFSVEYTAMEKIGGDFYDIIQLRDDKIGIIIADVSGHGIPAALVTTMAKISFGNAGAKHDSPRRIFQEVNQNILDHVKTQDYLTCFMVVIDDDYNVQYSNASHQKAVILNTNTGEFEYLDTDGLFIGALEEAGDSYGEAQTKLNYGDRLILYTDGITEAMNAERMEYGNSNLERAIVEKRHLPVNDFSKAIIEDLRRHIGGAQIFDDITMIVIELVRDEAVDIVKRSKKLTGSNRYPEAVNMLKEGLEKYPENRKILYNLSKNYFRMNNYEMAVEVIDRYIQNDERNKYACYIGGASCYQLGIYDQAVDYFEKAIALDAVFVYALFALAMTYKQSGRIDEAVKIFERVVNLDHENKMALYQLRLLEEEGRLHKE